MTNWLPDLASGSGPLYQRLADRIEADIDTGALASGAKLPPQRDLAYDIGATVGTVGRAYALLRERGLVSGEVGRGTYVLPRAASADTHSKADAHRFGTRFLDAPDGKLRLDSTAAPEVGQSAIIEGILAGILRDHQSAVARYTRQFEPQWFEAGSRWLARNDFRPTPDTIVPTLGVHAGVIATIAALTAPGDQIVFEHLSYAQISRGSALIGRRPVLVRSDQDGIDPADFESVCAQKHPAAAFLMPTTHNPTVVTMPRGRREDIVRIARAHNVLLIEDDLYGHLSDDPNPLLAELAPERTITLGGLSKSAAAGVRGGWLSCPPAFCHRIRVAHRLAGGGMAFLLAEIAARLVLSGQAAELRSRCIAEINARLDMLRAALAGYDFNSRPNIPFVWLALTDPWLSGTFKNAAYKSGVLVDDEDEFKAGRSDLVFHRARLGLAPSHTRQEFAGGLAIIRRLLEEGSTGYESFG